MGSFADDLDYKIKREQENPFLDDALINRLHKKQKRQIETYRSKLDDFREIYGDEIVDKDKKEIERLEGIFASQEESPESERINQVAEITEGIVVNNLSGEWLDNQAEATPASVYDDYKRGVDAIIEFFPQQEDQAYEYLGAMLDVTLDTQAKLSEKLDRVWKRHISTGRMTEIKYFEGSEIKGSLKLPCIVLSLDSKHVKELMKLEDRNKREEIGKHPVQAVILFQIQRQLRAYHSCAVEQGKDETAQVAMLAGNRIIEIFLQKEAEIEGFNDILQDDPGSIAIDEYFTQRGV